MKPKIRIRHQYIHLPHSILYIEVTSATVTMTTPIALSLLKNQLKRLVGEEITNHLQQKDQVQQVRIMKVRLYIKEKYEY